MRYWPSSCKPERQAGPPPGTGYRTELIIGVRKAEQRLDAHAWLNWQDFVVTGGQVDEYSELRPTDRL